MKSIHTPVRTTVVYGLTAALSFVPVGLATRYGPLWMPSLCLFGWAALALYGRLLVRWAGARPAAVVFPLLLLLPAPFALRSPAFFFVALLAVLSWMRSGVCFPRPVAAAVALEGAIGGGGMLLVALLAPRSVVTWSLGIWLFFLVQALYFLPGRAALAVDAPPEAPDPFARARRRAERILSES